MYVKPMLPSLSLKKPEGSQWSFEIKFDGFRALLSISESAISFTSRNGKDLAPLFPEIIEAVRSSFSKFQPFMPCTLDGELTVLQSAHKASFEKIQKRGRLKKEENIQRAVHTDPCTFLVFDLIECAGEKTAASPLKIRKEKLLSLSEACGFPLTPAPGEVRIQYVPSFSDGDALFKNAIRHDSEGILAKDLNSRWEPGIRTKNWLKIKNYKYGLVFIIGYDKKNGYFKAGTFDHGTIREAGVFSHGLEGEERESLIEILRQNKEAEDPQWITIAPAICVELQFLGLYKNQLREPSFHAFRFDLAPELCTWSQLKVHAVSVHEDVQLTNPDKPLWNKPVRSKEDYLAYLIDVSESMLPFLEDKHLTVIRYPHGTSDEAFYQKNCPDYAPDFIKTSLHEGIEYILCNDHSTLLWLGNQGAIEFHVPFQTRKSHQPNEIVFDLDPPSRNEFGLAVKAALEMHKLFESFSLTSFPKLSGGKGIQIHIPITEGTFSYEQTRSFTEFIASYLVQVFPEAFTIERLKKNRGNRLYVDYIQHAEGKTIISPYSLRGNSAGAYAAAPLYWEEVKDSLNPDSYTMNTVADRLQDQPCPFADFFTSPQDKVITQILHFIEEQKSKE
ncbi:DNA ligase D [Metabacillus indicus]|uniref:DNA ligase D n=1 Tax=Metabacillus indicus TaxID=246786 RepID=UPI0039843AB6